MMDNRYRKYSEHLKEKHGAKTYKLPVNLPVSCPNRDGLLSHDGCIFCGEAAAGFESLSDQLSVEEQLRRNMAYIGKRYKAEKFIAYFQNFTNTYMPVEAFKERMESACLEGIVEICVSTRPDCLDERYLEALKSVSERKNVSVSVELGLQSVNYRTLDKLNRGHSLGEFIHGALLTRAYGFELGVHLILNLPWDDERDAVEAAKILSALKVGSVKLHSLYILRNTRLGDLYRQGKVSICSLEAYVERTCLFLEHLDPAVAVQRLAARAPEEKTLFCNWGMSWWKVRDAIEEALKERGTRQGSSFTYLENRAALKFDK